MGVKVKQSHSEFSNSSETHLQRGESGRGSRATSPVFPVIFALEKLLDELKALLKINHISNFAMSLGTWVQSRFVFPENR